MYPFRARLGRPPNNPLPAMMLSPQHMPQIMPQPMLSPIVWQPMEQATDSGLEQTVLRIIHGYRPDSSNAIYDAKIAEFFEYCHSLYPHDPFATILNSYKVYRFIFYQCMRSQKKRGGTHERRVTGRNFSRTDFDSVMSHYNAWFNSNDGSQPPEPQKPLGRQSIDQYKQSLRQIYKDQQAKKVLALTWDQIWQMPADNLYRLVKDRRQIINKNNYEEKFDQNFSGYAAVEQYPKIEEQLWKRGETNQRSAYANLRHRYCFLHTTSGIL